MQQPGTPPPPEVRDALLDILRRAILQIRNCGCERHPGYCAHEANHVHNLPTLLGSYSYDLLAYYWRVERPEYIAGLRAMPPRADAADGYAAAWRVLERYVKAGPAGTPEPPSAGEESSW